jgi:hypothetical protein
MSSTLGNWCIFQWDLVGIYLLSPLISQLFSPSKGDIFVTGNLCRFFCDSHIIEQAGTRGSIVG